jgi:hypothetical protein
MDGFRLMGWCTIVAHWLSSGRRPLITEKQCNHRRGLIAIGNAAQLGRLVFVSNGKGGQLTGQFAGSGPKDARQGYTSSTVKVARGSLIYPTMNGPTIERDIGGAVKQEKRLGRRMAPP